MMIRVREKFQSVFFILIIFSCFSCATRAQSQIPSDEKQLAFPGAEGYGRYATGGRGGRVYVVTNLNDSGAGSLREGVKAKDSRTIVFALSGTIHLESELTIQGNVTIAGQTAPGDGICIADYPVTLKGDNVIIRFLRFRMGDKNQNKGKVPGSGHDDAFGGSKRQNIIIDHCSMSWSTDEAISFYAGDNITLQWNIISEPLNYSYHFEEGDTDFEKHGYGGIWGGRHASFHHNLFAHCASRTPRFDGIRNIDSENVDYRNNVIYNWAENNVYAGEGGNYNIVNNYYKYGPSTANSKKFRIVNPYKTSTIPFGKFYVDGNYVDGAPEMSGDNWIGVLMNDGTEADKISAKAAVPFKAQTVTTQSSLEAYKSVLSHAGSSLPVRDTLDHRIVRNVEERTGTLIDVQGGYQHGTPYSVSATAWPELKSSPAPADKDQDGIPDEWEIKNKLNPSDNSDASKYGLQKYYTNIEVYLNSLVKLKQ